MACREDALRASAQVRWHPTPVLLPGESHMQRSLCGSRRVGHDWATSLSLFTLVHWRRKWQPTPVFLPGESQDGGAWWAAVSGVAQNRTRLKRLSSSSSSCQTPFPAVLTGKLRMEFLSAWAPRWLRWAESRVDYMYGVSEMWAWAVLSGWNWGADRPGSLIYLT